MEFTPCKQCGADCRELFSTIGNPPFSGDSPQASVVRAIKSTLVLSGSSPTANGDFSDMSMTLPALSPPGPWDFNEEQDPAGTPCTPAVGFNLPILKFKALLTDACLTHAPNTETTMATMIRILAKRFRRNRIWNMCAKLTLAESQAKETLAKGKDTTAPSLGHLVASEFQDDKYPRGSKPAEKQRMPGSEVLNLEHPVRKIDFLCMGSVSDDEQPHSVGKAEKVESGALDTLAKGSLVTAPSLSPPARQGNIVLLPPSHFLGPIGGDNQRYPMGKAPRVESRAMDTFAKGPLVMAPSLSPPTRQGNIVLLPPSYFLRPIDSNKQRHPVGKIGSAQAEKVESGALDTLAKGSLVTAPSLSPAARQGNIVLLPPSHFLGPIGGNKQRYPEGKIATLQGNTI